MNRADIRVTILAVKTTIGPLLGALLLGIPAPVQAQYTLIYQTNGSAIIVTGHTGTPVNVQIPDFVTSIGGQAFIFCNTLTNVIIGTNTSSIGDNAFYSCFHLVSCAIPNKVSSIGDGAFQECFALSAVNIPLGLTKIGAYGFDDCVLTSITVPSNLVSIGPYAFGGCRAVTNISIANGAVGIGLGMFAGCTNLTTVSIPSSINTIGVQAFDGCNSLTNFTVDAQNANFASEGGALFNRGLTVLIDYPAGLGGSYAIPEGVTNIGSYAIGSVGLTNISIPDTATSISSGALYGCTALTTAAIPKSVTSIGMDPFGGCTSLTNLEVDPGNPSYESVNGVLFDKDATTLIQYPLGRIGNYLIPYGVTSIEGSAFYGCAGLSGVTIPDTVTNINEAAFEGTGLTNVSIPSSVTTIGDYAFFGCIHMANVLFTGDAPPADANTFLQDKAIIYYFPGTTGWSVFSSSTGLTSVLWNPSIQITNGTIGIVNNQFGFNVTGGTNLPIVVEACANLSSPDWAPVTNVLLTNGSFYFTDPQWTNYPARYYGLGFP